MTANTFPHLRRLNMDFAQALDPYTNTQDQDQDDRPTDQFFDATVPEPSLWFAVAGSLSLVLLAWLVLRRFGPSRRRHATSSTDHLLPTVNTA